VSCFRLGLFVFRKCYRLRLGYFIYIDYTISQGARNGGSNLIITRNAWQSLAYSPLGAIVSPPGEYL